jgi:hypothetical protein
VIPKFTCIFVIDYFGRSGLEQPKSYLPQIAKDAFNTFTRHKRDYILARKAVMTRFPLADGSKAEPVNPPNKITDSNPAD